MTGVCSGSRADLVRSLGAREVVDYTAEDFADGSRRFDLILDIGGRTSVARLRRALTRTGTLVIVGGEGDRWIGGTQRQLWANLLSAFVPQELVAFVVKEHARELLTMNELVAAGKVTPSSGLRSRSRKEQPPSQRLRQGTHRDGSSSRRDVHTRSGPVKGPRPARGEKTSWEQGESQVVRAPTRDTCCMPAYPLLPVERPGR